MGEPLLRRVILYSKLEGTLSPTSENPIPERVNISSDANDRCEAISGKFPALGSVGLVRRVAALISLKQNGYLKTAPYEESFDTRSLRITRESATEIPSPSKGNQYPILFPTLVQLLAGKKLTYMEIYQQVAWHTYLGSIVLKELADKANTIEELYKLLLDMVPEGLAEAPIVSSVGDEEEGLSVRIGAAQDGADVYWPLTNTAKIENPHACIIGTSGQGKTQFALDILHQIREQNPDVSFTVLDYKGDLSDAGSSSRQMFEAHLGCKVVSPGVEPIPTVPFQNAYSRDAAQYAIGVTDLLTQFYGKMGSIQRLALRECLAELISAETHSNGVGFPVLEERLQE